jgi:MtN3 and saliva related transmembrane protein
MPEAVGWLSSFVLLLTLITQMRKQWKERTSKGVSKWLYLGQVASEVGFAVYSWLVGNWIFVITNLLLVLSNLVGLGIVLHHRRLSRRAATPADRQAA